MRIGILQRDIREINSIDSPKMLFNSMAHKINWQIIRVEAIFRCDQRPSSNRFLSRYLVIFHFLHCTNAKFAVAPSTTTTTMMR